MVTWPSGRGGVKSYQIQLTCQVSQSGTASASKVIYGFALPETMFLLYATESHSVAPEPIASASPGNLIKMHILRPSPDLLGQKFWGTGIITCVSISPPDDFDAYQYFGTTVLNYVFSQPPLIYKIPGQDPLVLMECQDKIFYKS